MGSFGLVRVLLFGQSETSVLSGNTRYVAELRPERDQVLVRVLERVGAERRELWSAPAPWPLDDSLRLLSDDGRFVVRVSRRYGNREPVVSVLSERDRHDFPGHRFHYQPAITGEWLAFGVHVQTLATATGDVPCLLLTLADGKRRQVELGSGEIWFENGGGLREPLHVEPRLPESVGAQPADVVVASCSPNP